MRGKGGEGRVKRERRRGKGGKGRRAEEKKGKGEIPVNCMLNIPRPLPLGKCSYNELTVLAVCPLLPPYLPCHHTSFTTLSIPHSVPTFPSLPTLHSSLYIHLPSLPSPYLHLLHHGWLLGRLTVLLLQRISGNLSLSSSSMAHPSVVSYSPSFSTHSVTTLGQTGTLC